jgi:protein Tex
MADRFVRDPHEVLAVGQVVRVWVVKIDQERRRVSLSMVAPVKHEPRPASPRPEGRPSQGSRGDGGRPPRPEGRGGGPARGRGAPQHGRGGGRPPQQQHHEYRPKVQPKPLKPLTEGMKKGDEPLRTFGDLMQFFQMKKEPPPDEAAKDAPPSKKKPEDEAGNPPA